MSRNREVLQLGLYIRALLCITHAADSPASQENSALHIRQVICVVHMQMETPAKDLAYLVSLDFVNDLLLRRPWITDGSIEDEVQAGLSRSKAQFLFAMRSFRYGSLLTKKSHYVHIVVPWLVRKPGTNPLPRALKPQYIPSSSGRCHHTIRNLELSMLITAFQTVLRPSGSISS